MLVNKESVELTLVYQVGGCGKTLTTINDAIPHTWIVWGYVRKMRTAT